jgi:hypothetical protein
LQFKVNRIAAYQWKTQFFLYWTHKNVESEVLKLDFYDAINKNSKLDSIFFYILTLFNYFESSKEKGVQFFRSLI